jgi:hypothetical protein
MPTMLGPKKMPKGQFWLLHSLVVLSLLALWGYMETDARYLVLLSALSFCGALCVAFIAVVRR